MRQAINNNPMAQLGLLGALVLVIGVLLVPQMMGKKGSSDSSSTTASATLTSPQGTVDVNVTATPSATGATGATAAPPPQTVDPQDLVPGPGLPQPVIAAWKHGDTVVLLVVRNGGIDDRLVKNSVKALSQPGTAVFVTKAKSIARYSRITQGVGVGQVPALVIVRPRKVSGGVPEAQVSYGFRDSKTVVQAVHDALYSGKDNLPYSPR
ncbi:MAG TPA: hypothetical protein VH329_04340 [Solirubrobacterales bacterium]|jgi:hypothetical protein